MPLVPKRVKHRREFRGKMRGAAKGGWNQPDKRLIQAAKGVGGKRGGCRAGQKGGLF